VFFRDLIAAVQISTSDAGLSVRSVAAEYVKTQFERDGDKEEKFSV